MGRTMNVPKVFTFFILMAMLTNLSCSNLSQNIIKEGSFQINGGYKDKLRWEDPLPFKRYSWYQELTLMFDILVAKMPPESPFYHWLSDAEKKMVAPCQDFLLVLTYALEDKKISEGMFRDQMALSGYDQWILRDFQSFLVNHPDFEKQALKLYHLHSFCKMNGPADPNGVPIRFPNFPEKFITP
jgi:hypothetical protein